MKLTRTGRLATTLAALIALAACGTSASDTDSASASGSNDLVPLKIGGPWNGASGKTPVLTGPLGYAIHQDLAQPILAKYGFEYDEFVSFSNGPPVAQALQTGDLQVGVIGDTPAVQSRASGLEVSSVAIAKPTADIWFLTKEGGVKSLDELAGKKVALQFGSNFDKYGRAVLERAGVLDDVELVNLLFADTLPALQRGEVDAVPVPASTAGLWRKTTEFPVISKASVDDPDLLATTVTLVPDALLEKEPDLAKAVWEATKAGQEAIAADHDGYLAFLSESTGAPLDVVKDEQLFAYSDVPADPDGLKAVDLTLKFLLDSGTAKQGFDTKTWTVE
jgi:sulfonate transport system substrate-binding protein